MRLIEGILSDHRLIDRLVGSLFCWGYRGAEDPVAATNLDNLVRFFTVFVHEYHHRREEVLFQALVEHGEVPGHRGPLAILREEHDAARRVVAALGANGVCAESTTAAMTLAGDLWQHLDKEDSVLLPEAERRLIDGGIRELEDPTASIDPDQVMMLGNDLVRRLPPMDDPDLIRGFGCIPCEAFGDRCHGIETEWWSDWEREHHASLDEG
jgi:hemerythrin-like domain-containing protein